ncbi:hypothetical protein ANCDUO_00367 [Ancylostoma duodenale]|uniref:Uncharacterized protein n=1 Tax=Ancylostoma duodenale TaxID=51022 RepID=A0A0C2HI16_9BILA|nr:hypothetical protein ANCDUO_00367 [Ancylostoma duodenale]
MNFRLFGIPLEFVNLLTALVAYACAYPAVFWRVSKPFSLIFSFHMVIHCAAVIWGYLGFSILFRIQETNYNSLRPVGLGQYLVQSRNWPFYHPYAIIATLVGSLVLMTTAPVALYSYGYNKYFVNVMNFQAKNHIRAGSSAGQSEYSEYKRRNYSRPPSRELCCDGYAPHTVAIVLLVLIVVVRAPTIYALMILYQKGLATGHIKGNENPSQLKNSLIVMQRDHQIFRKMVAVTCITLLLFRDQSPYQRSAIKLTSFNATEKGGVYGSVPSQWATQRAPPGQPSQLLWSANKPTVSASSSQQEQCFTPTSTLTSQGSTSNYDGQTPTPGSPQTNTPLYGRANNSGTGGGGGVYGTLGDDSSFTDRTLQKPLRAVSTGSTSVRHTVKVVAPRNDDSANFSLTSSNGSSEANKTSNDFATSIV